METKGKGKAIIGIAMAAIMLASVFAVMMPSTVARDGTGKIEQGNVVYRTSTSAERGLDVSGLIASGGTFYGIADSTADGGLLTVAENTSFNVPTTAKVGPYNASSREGTVADIIVDEAEITGNVYINNFGDSIVGKSVPVGTAIQIRASPNFGGILEQAGTGEAGVIKIKVTPPESTTREETFPANVSDVDVNSTQWDELDTTGWKTGAATVQITSVKEDCNDLDVSSAVYEFTVRSEKLTIKADADEVGKGERIKLTVSGNPSTWYYFAIEDVVTDKELEVADTSSVTPVAGEGTTDKPCAAWVKTSASGTREIEISTTGADERTYTMHVYYGFTGVVWETPNTDATFTPAQAEDANPTEDDDEKVKVVEATVTFEVPAKAIIGEDVDIEGAISAGDEVNVVIKDEKVVETDEMVDENDEFSVEWDTDGMTTGSYTIEVYIDFDEVEYGDGDVLDSYDGVDPDGKATIRLISPGLDATQPRNVVAEEDDYTLEGTATGVSDVDYALVGPKGLKKTDHGDIRDGLLLTRASVSDDEFSEDETMVEGVDTGVWLTIVMSPGRDGIYEATEKGSISEDDLEDLGVVEGKSQSQIVAIIEDAITQAGSDDLMEALSFKVESGYVDLNPVESVGVGDPLNISGVTNREPETSITISTFAGPTDMLALVDVEWTTADEGTFSATIDTSDAVEGTYTLEADDGDGHTDTITVVIGAAAPEPTATAVPTAEPTATAIPTAAPTAEPTAEPTATPEEPGFEAVFAIAGLLSIAYLVLRRRK